MGLGARRPRTAGQGFGSARSGMAVAIQSPFRTRLLLRDDKKYRGHRHAAGKDNDAVHPFSRQQPAKEDANDRIDEFVRNGDDRARVRQQPEIAGVADDRPKDDQIGKRRPACGADPGEGKTVEFAAQKSPEQALQPADRKSVV